MPSDGKAAPESRAASAAQDIRAERGTDRGWGSLAVSLTLRAAIRPRLATDLLRTVWAFRRRAWYRRFPFLPLPPREYLAWRMETAYGRGDAVPSAEDVERFARWRREVMHL